MGAPRTKPLPPPREVIDHDNAVSSVPQPRMKSIESNEKTAPVEQVNCAIMHYNNR